MDELLKCQGKLKQVTQYVNDLEMELIVAQEDAAKLIEFDPLTQVYRNDILVKRLKRKNNHCYLLLNIDNFSNINNAYGYDVGNELLQETAKLLKRIQPDSFELYRFCSDRFVLLSNDKKEKYELMRIAETILSFFNETDISIQDHIPVNVSFSIGISTAVGLSAIVEAEVALKELRKVRRNYYNIYNQKLQTLKIQQENVYWIDKIKSSILTDIAVHFQAIMNNATGEIEKYECLSRIEDQGEMISPFRFMEAAYQTRVLHLMTQSVISKAFQKFQNTSCEFSINITKDDLFMEYLENYLLKHCVKYNIDPSRVVLEILENISSLNEKSILTQLDSLRINGFKIAIDDFGAENSNMSRLLEFKPDYLKIDGAFIKNIVEDKKSRLITESIVYICKQSGIKVIAEYIHNKEVLEVVKEIGIDYSQGYYIGAPSTELLN